MGNGEDDLQKAIEKVKEANPQEESDEDEINNNNNNNNLILDSTINNSNSLIESPNNQNNSQLVNSCRCENNQKLMISQTTAIDYFESREYKGLVATVESGQDTDIHPGQYGNSHKYSPNYIEKS